ncbi:hypothetical protein [Staphylospora marina]|uniref:hypothetical protein n=1 Tax=Staphylospora marina TaxID=2490858 RepID=UPI000F5BEDFC|nr:hypothetical protein [Staphylospora marina]
MPCSYRNLLKNSGFTRGLAPWTGSGIMRIHNPLREGDWAVLMNSPGDILKQIVQGPFETGCAYYLYFRALNLSGPGAEFFATVAWLDAGKRIIRSTPLQILPPRTGNKWYSYFSIVPPPPRRAAYASVSFYHRAGAVLVDYIRLSSHDI